MTNQVPEILIIDSGAIELPAMNLYGITAGNLDDPKSWGPYPFGATGDKAKMIMCSALWRGYVSTYRFRPDGTLALEKMAYPFTEGASPDEVHEILRGDFWLDFRESFTGDRVDVPFENGSVLCDQTRWKRSEGITWKRLALERDAANSASLIVSADQTVTDGMQGYKVYVNGNVHSTPSHYSHLAPPNGIYTRLKPGACRVVVREADHTKTDRAESNTLNVEARAHRALHLKVTLVGTTLTLVQEAF